MASDIKKPTDAKLNENKWADNLKYLSSDDTTSAKIASKIDSMLSALFGANSKLLSNRSPFKVILNALREIQALNFFWNAESINEHNILLAENVESIQGIAAIHGFQRNRGIAASGLVKIEVAGDLVNDTSATVLEIKNYAQIRNKKNNLIYTIYLRQESYFVDFSSGVTLEVLVRQGQIGSLTHIGDGNYGATAEISSSKKIENNNIKVVVDNSNTNLDIVNLKREAVSNPNSVLLRNGFDGNVILYFGDRNSGYTPKLGESLTITWLDTEGLLGNTLANYEFDIVSGFFVNGEELSKTKQITIRAKADFVNGYDGDDIDTVRLNTGAQTLSSVIATPTQVKSYLRQYQKFTVSDVWREPRTSIIHALLTPNLALLTKGRSYFDLNYNDFITSDVDKQSIFDSIANEQNTVLVSTIRFENYIIAEFGAIIMIKVEDRTILTDGLKKRIRSTVSDSLVESFTLHSRQIRRSDLITALTNNVPEVSSIDVQFLGDEQYIDEIGDIDTSVVNQVTGQTIVSTIEQDYVIPKLSAINTNDVQFDEAIKILVENDIQTWIEI